MGLEDADSAEHGEPSANLLITAVACPMPDRSTGAPNLHGAATIHLRRGTRAWEIYGRDEVSERYFCNYEVNPAYRDALEAAGLALSGFSDNSTYTLSFWMACLEADCISLPTLQAYVNSVAVGSLLTARIPGGHMEEIHSHVVVGFEHDGGHQNSRHESHRRDKRSGRRRHLLWYL